MAKRHKTFGKRGKTPVKASRFGRRGYDEGGEVDGAPPSGPPSGNGAPSSGPPRDPDASPTPPDELSKAVGTDWSKYPNADEETETQATQRLHAPWKLPYRVDREGGDYPAGEAPSIPGGFSSRMMSTPEETLRNPYAGGGEYAEGGEVQQRPSHAHRNDHNQPMIANAARRDPYKAARLMQGLRREHNGLRHLGAQALGQSHGLRSVGRHELAHGHDAFAMHLLNHAHSKVPDGAEVNFTQHGDHHFNANVKRNGQESNYPLSRDQMMQWAIGPPGSFDHSMTNGVEKNLNILTRRQRGPVQGYQGGGEVEGYTGAYDPSMDTYAPDDDRSAIRRIYDWWQGLHFGGGEGGTPSSVRDYVNGTGEHSATPEEIDAERQTLAPTRAPTTVGGDQYDPLAGVKRFFSPQDSPLGRRTTPTDVSIPPEAFERDVGPESILAKPDIPPQAYDIPPEAFERGEPGRGGMRVEPKTAQRFEEYGGAQVTPEERQRLDKQAKRDREYQRQVDAGEIKEGEQIKNPYDTLLQREFPGGEPNVKPGVTAARRRWDELNDQRRQWNLDHLMDPRERRLTQPQPTGPGPVQTAPIAPQIPPIPPQDLTTQLPNVVPTPGAPVPYREPTTPEERARNLYPWASQGQRRRAYEEELRTGAEKGEQQMEIERLRAAGKDTAADKMERELEKQRGLTERAEAKNKTYRERTEMLGDTKMAEIAQRALTAKEHRVYEGVIANWRNNPDYKPVPEEQAVIDKVRKEAAETTAKSEQQTRGAEQEQKGQQQQQQKQQDYFKSLNPRLWKKLPNGNVTHPDLPSGMEIDDKTGEVIRR